LEAFIKEWISALEKRKKERKKVFIYSCPGMEIRLLDMYYIQHEPKRV
jgi:hypothetical protein